MSPALDQVGGLTEPQQNQKIWDNYIEGTYAELRSIPISPITRNTNRGVVLIEPREHPHLEYVIRNVLYFLEPDWGLQIFSGNKNHQFVQNFTDGWGDIFYENLGVDDLSTRGYNHVKRTAEFWQRVRFEQVLWIEPDCLLRRRGVEEFLGYDYVGAPWGPRHAISPDCRVGNGGLSLRKRSAMLRVADNANTHHSLFAPEDMYFCVNMNLANSLQPGSFRLPEFETAQRFSVETVFHPNPLGLHKAWRFLPTEQLTDLLDGISYSDSGSER